MLMDITAPWRVIDRGFSLDIMIDASLDVVDCLLRGMVVNGRPALPCVRLASAPHLDDQIDQLIGLERSLVVGQQHLGGGNEALAIDGTHFGKGLKTVIAMVMIHCTDTDPTEVHVVL
ncbi:hypothetical protein D9M71_815490 [compost metagenome]